jgi:hypothetical protein
VPLIASVWRRSWRTGTHTAEACLAGPDHPADNGGLRHGGDLPRHDLALAGAFHDQGVAGLLRDKTRHSRIPPLGVVTEQRVVSRTFDNPPGETMHWTAAAMTSRAD